MPMAEKRKATKKEEKILAIFQMNQPPTYPNQYQYHPYKPRYPGMTNASSASQGPNQPIIIVTPTFTSVHKLST